MSTILAGRGSMQHSRDANLKHALGAGRPCRAQQHARLHMRSQNKQRRNVTSAAILDQMIKPLVARNKATPLNEGIANFYDQSSGLWEDMWGEHMHHGYYPKGQEQKSNSQAQVDMIEEVLSWAGVNEVKKAIDVGCGIGGSSRHIARKFKAKTTGITLSPVQAARANELASVQGLAAQSTFQVADALQQPFSDNSFDLVWSLESGEHMPQKPRFVNELVRVCAPGGKIIIVTWCHRNLAPGESGLTKEEQQVLDRICEAYYLPAWCSINDYHKLFEAEGLKDIKIADWSDEVSPFWGAVIKSAISGKGLQGLFTAGWSTIKGALVMPLMSQGYKMGLIKFALICGTKAS